MSAGYLSNVSYQTSPYKMNGDHTLKNPVEKQSITSIFSSNLNSSNKISIPITHNTNNNNLSNLSIRRTLSADMSSPKWLQNNGFSQSSVKRVQSSQHLHILGEEGNHVSIENNKDHDTNKGPAFEEIWSTIQADKRSWSSLLSPMKNDGSGSGSGSGSDSPPPYVHPLAKRSASSLSEKSLEICTESLGSETGSDGFSYPPSEPEDSDREQEVEQQHQQQQQEKEVEQEEEVEVISFKYNSCSYKGPTSKRSMMVPPSRPSFPPPLPSLAHRDDGSNLHIRSHRQDGRLVVEAVTVPSQNCFRAQRQDGRLLLTLTSRDEEDDGDENDHDHEVDDNAEVTEKEDDKQEATTDMVIEQDNDVEVEEEEDEGEEFEFQEEMVNVQRSYPTWTMTKLAELTSTRNKSIWPRNYNITVIKTLNHHGVEQGEEVEVAMKKFMPRVSTATATAVVLNTYEYYWRRGNSPTAAAVAVLKPRAGQQNNTNKTNVYSAAPQVEKDTRKNNKKLLFAAHNTKGVGLAEEEEVVVVKAAGGRGAICSTGEKA